MYAKVMVMTSRVIPSLLAAVALTGCSPPPEFAELRSRLYEDGAMLELLATASPADATIELEWSMTIENLSEQPCPVAVYAWIGDVRFPDPTLDRPNAKAPEDWPATWQGGKLIDAGLVAGMDRWTTHEPLVDEPSWLIYARYAIATCQSAVLRVQMRADAVVEYGPWTVDRGMYVSLSRLD